MIIRNNIAQNLGSNKNAKFWKEVKNVNKSKSNCKIIPNEIDGVVGSDICNLFKRNYENLYSDSKMRNFDMLMRECNLKIMNGCNDWLNDKANNHLHDVTYEHVKAAIGKLKNNKKDEHYLICSDAFKNAPPVLFYALSFIYNCMIKFCITTDVFNVVTIVPIAKNNRKSKMTLPTTEQSH